MMKLDVKNIIKENGLGIKEIKEIISNDSPTLRKKVWETASKIRREVHQNFLQGYAPLYISSYCISTCIYCPFNVKNKLMKRRRLIFEEIKKEAEAMVKIGHKNICILAGDDPMIKLEDYAEYINHLVSYPSVSSVIINIDVVPHEKFDFKRLMKLTRKNLFEFRVFQETYHKPTYEKVHGGWKADYTFRWHLQEKAAKAGVPHVGIGILLGLYDWKFEIFEMIKHGKYLLDKGYPLHTISIPRWQKALGVTYKPEYEVSDKDFFFFIALLKLAFPKQHLIITSRESIEIMDESYKVCTISDIEPKPYVGAYSGENEEYEQAEVKNKMTFSGFVEHFKKLGYKLIDCFNKN